MLRAAGDIQATHSAADGVEASWSTAREVMLVRVFQTSRLPTLQASNEASINAGEAEVLLEGLCSLLCNV